MADGKETGEPVVGPELKLVIAGPGSPRSEVKLTRDRTIVGRAPGCDVVVDDPDVLPEHFALERTPNGFQLTRLPGPAAVRVNGEIASQRMIHNGDEIEIGHTTLRVTGLQ